jgi:predicted Na+-dependent transporter
MEEQMIERLLIGFLVSLTTIFFVMVLPFLLGLLLIPTLPEDDRFFLKGAFTFLSPFSAVLWYIVVSHLALRRRAGYLMQLVIFVGTAGLIYLLLINGVYHL